MVNAGIIGCGNIAWKWDSVLGGNFTTHAKSYYKTRGVRLVACCDPKFEKAKALARAYPGTLPYNSFRTMLAKHKLDLVSVCAPTPAHYEILCYLLKDSSIKHILAEKPLTSKVEETKEIFSLAKKQKAHISLNYIRRWDTTFSELALIIKKKSLGEFQFGKVIYYGGFKRNGLHLVDYLNLLGLEFNFVRPLSKVIRYADDFGASLLFQTNNKQPFYFHWVDEDNCPCLEIDLFYKKGRVRIGDLGDVDIFRVGRSAVYRGFPELVLWRRFPSTMHTAMKNSVRHMVECAAAGKIDYDSLADEVKLMDLVGKIENKLWR